MAPQSNTVQGMVVRPALPPPRSAADIYETPGGDAYVIEITVPGLKPDEIAVEATSHSLRLSTQPKRVEPEPGRRYIERQQPIRPVSRLFEFSTEIDTDQIRATLEHGILKVRVPKAASGQPKIIEIKHVE
jgi:HSP20 family protein